MQAVLLRPLLNRQEVEEGEVVDTPTGLEGILSDWTAGSVELRTIQSETVPSANDARKRGIGPLVPQGTKFLRDSQYP